MPASELKVGDVLSPGTCKGPPQHVVAVQNLLAGHRQLWIAPDPGAKAKAVRVRGDSEFVLLDS